jgi:hypothetical protein
MSGLSQRYEAEEKDGLSFGYYGRYGGLYDDGAQQTEPETAPAPAQEPEQAPAQPETRPAAAEQRAAEPRSVEADQGLLREALSRGIRSPRRLTDIIFFARHPDLKDNPAWSNDGALLDEWRQIRERLVVPEMRQRFAPRSRIVRYRRARPMRLHGPAHFGFQDRDGLGWFIDTKINATTTPAGHEILTERAAKGLINNKTELNTLIAGVRRPDLADLNNHIKLGEQKRHFLRSGMQPSWNAWFSATDHLQILHQNILASTSRLDQLGLIGEALHLIQDSFAPAHVEREPLTGEILYIRVYDPKPGPQDHAYLIDQRDAIFAAQPPKLLTAGAQRAISCSREYLQMALKHLQLASILLPPLAQQAKQDLRVFIARRLWFRFPDLRVGAQDPLVGVMQGHLNGWLLTTASTLPHLSGNTFDSDTQNAVLEFQKATGLPLTGTVDRETWKKLLLP